MLGFPELLPALRPEDKFSIEKEGTCDSSSWCHDTKAEVELWGSRIGAKGGETEKDKSGPH